MRSPPPGNTPAASAPSGISPDPEAPSPPLPAILDFRSAIRARLSISPRYEFLFCSSRHSEVE
ncbi:MAG: hypothetical protein C0454_08870 [Parvibaculum sp.]|nr:hypothetical protein [Parvibaculum sp.]